MAYMGNQKHLETGDAAPKPPAKDALRVYGMKFCPFVHRLKLVLAAKGIDHETVNCNLVRKPEFLFAVNPRGKVPVIEKNGEIVYESDITSDFVDAAYQGKRKVTTSDPLRRAKERMLEGDLNQAIAGFFALGRATDEAGRATALKQLRHAFSALEIFLRDNQHHFIGGEQPSMTDYMVWPFLERIAIRSPELIREHKIAHAYCNRMSKDPAVEACRFSDELQAGFWIGYFAENPVYDVGTVEPSL